MFQTREGLGSRNYSLVISRIMPELVDWERAEPRELIQHAVRLLMEGEVVVFPTETAYVAAASVLAPGAAARLRGHGNDSPIAFGVCGAGGALDWAPKLSHVGRRLARRCWPGPVTLVSGDGAEHGLASRLPQEVRDTVCPDSMVRLRTPAHEAILQVMRLLPGPLLLAEVGNGAPANTASEAAEAVGDGAALVIDDGPSRFTRPATVVRVEGDRWDVVSEGVFSAEALGRLLPCRIVFVCTGNTCRSPLAEALCKKLLADKLGCTPADLPARGFLVHSAGIAAMMGGEATVEAVDTARDLGADLSGHRSQPLTAEMLTQADHVIAMTRGHLRALSDRGARLGPSPRLLSRQGEDVADPIGAAPEVYRACARQILQHLEELLPELH